MTSLRSLACLAAVVLVVLALVLKPAPDSKERAQSTREAADSLQKVLNLKADSYHVLLREASLLLPPALVGQEWAAVQELMRQNSFAAAEAWENGAAVHSYHLLRRRAFTFPNGHSLDLYLLLSSPNRDHPREPVRPGKFCKADVALVADLNAPAPQLIGEKRYPKGPVLDVILGSEKVREAGEVWPLLRRVYVHYGYIGNRWVEHNPSGFHVSVEFAASAAEEDPDKRMFFHVASGLDPLQSWDGKEKILEGFKPRDTLGGIEEAFSIERWPGEKDVVAARTRAYLRSSSSWWAPRREPGHLTSKRLADSRDDTFHGHGERRSP